MVPTQVGPYTVTGTLGRGGMGVVLRARHPRLPTEVAIKLILQGALGDEAAVSRFRAEVTALARIKHVNVVPVLDSGRAHDGSPYYVMPLVTGRSLAQVLETDGPQAPERAATIVKKLALALETAHAEAAVIHRDLKPANVIVEAASGEPMLLDFGLAKRSSALGASNEGPRTETGAILGTPEYMAPEQAEGVSTLIDARTDVYGLGALLYALLTGKPPHPAQGRSFHQVVADVLFKEPVAIAKLAPRTPRDLEAIARQAMANEKERRYASARELALDLGRFLEGKPVAARPPGRWARVQRLLARNSVAVIGVLAVFGIMSAVAVSFAVSAHGALERERRLEAERRPLQAVGLLQDALGIWGTYGPSAASPDPAIRARAAEARRIAVDAVELLGAATPDSRVEHTLESATALFMGLRYLDEARDQARLTVDRFPRSFEALGVLHLLLHMRHEPCAEVRARIKKLAVEEGVMGKNPVESAVELEEALGADDLASMHRLATFTVEHKYVDLFGCLERARCAAAFARKTRQTNWIQAALIEFDQYLISFPTDLDVSGERWLLSFELGTLDFDGRGSASAVKIDHPSESALIANVLSRVVRLDRDGALEASRQIAAVAPGSPLGPLAHIARARALLLAEEFPEAVAETEHASGSPVEHEALTARGYALLALDREDEALAAFERATDPGPVTTANANVWAEKGRRWILGRRGMDPAARDALENRIQESQVRDRFARDPLLALRLAEECARRGNAPAAIQCAQDLIHLWGELTTAVPLPTRVTDLCARLGVNVEYR
jgi:hypothetical protein